LGDDAARVARYVPELHAILERGMAVLPPVSADRCGSTKSALADLRQIEDEVGYRRPEPERALFEAAATGDTTGVTRAIASGAAPNARDRDGRAALHLAAAAGQTASVIALLETGADIDLREAGEGPTAVLLAMQRHQSETVLALVEHGADVTLATHGATPLAAGCRQR
jgi:ankyrin repeat protein